MLAQSFCEGDSRPACGLPVVAPYVRNYADQSPIADDVGERLPMTIRTVEHGSEGVIYLGLETARLLVQMRPARRCLRSRREC